MKQKILYFIFNIFYEVKNILFYFQYFLEKNRRLTPVFFMQQVL